MPRFFFALLATTMFFNALNAQTASAPTSRLTTQQLSTAAANLQKETNEVEGFARKLASLKSAFAEKDASRIVAYEAHILRGMRNETDQMLAKNAANPTADTKTRLEKMTATMAAFEAYAFDTNQPEAATRDFAQLDAFLKIMQDELADLKNAKN